VYGIVEACAYFLACGDSQSNRRLHLLFCGPLDIWKMTQEQFFAFSKEMHDKAHEITLIKNKDYSPGDNPFSNFETLKDEFGDDFPLKLLVARIREKCDRLVSYVNNGHSDKNSEPEENDFIDIANYAFLMLGYIKHIRENK
jgi:isocitrate dehydrogenase kinase/phosphatase